jgi:hypothetical protein
VKHIDGTMFSCPGCCQKVKKRRPWFIDYRYGIDDSLVLFAPRDRVHGDIVRDQSIELEMNMCDWHYPVAPVGVSRLHGSPSNEMHQFMHWEQMQGTHRHHCYECKLWHRRKLPWWHQFIVGKKAPGRTIVKPPHGRVLGEWPDNTIQFYLELCDWHEK